MKFLTLGVVFLAGLLGQCGTTESESTIKLPPKKAIVGTNWSCTALAESEVGGSYEDSGYLAVRKNFQPQKFAIKHDSPIIKLISPDWLENRFSDPIEFQVIEDTDEALVATKTESEIVRTVDSWVLNKNTGLAIWSRMFHSGVNVDVPSATATYMFCTQTAFGAIDEFDLTRTPTE